ncbi:MAG TPA: hypothetical protein PLH72_12210 [Vicinamibacterales bacterium]|nr:hypothetical protein [Vicinamibacterales bacterium]
MSRPTLELASSRCSWLVALTLVIASASGAFAQTVTATWDRNTDSYTAGYRLYYGNAPGTYATNVDTGNQTSRQLTLSPGQTYYFVVRAYNSTSELGPASTEASVTISPLPPAPPTAQITASLGANSTALVSWQTTNASSVAINGATVAASGSAQYPISTTTTYSIVATGAGGTATASATVVVPRVDCVMSAWSFQSATPWAACTSGQRTRNETWIRSVVTPPSGGGTACGALQEIRAVSEPCTLPPTAQITAVAGSTPGTAVVSWQTTNATSAALNGAAVGTSGSTVYNLSATTTYTLVATGPGGSATASATVVVPRVDCVMSSWSFQSATPWGACTSGQRTRNETWIRSVVTPPSGGGTACGALQEIRAVSGPCTLPPTAQITAVAGSAAGTASVTWQTTNAASATINGAPVAASGSAVYTISGTTTFTLVATGPGGSATASATVTVTRVDCVVSDWSFQSATEWGQCTGGRQTRTETWTRAVLTPPSDGGAACGALSELRVTSQTCTDPTPALPGVTTSVETSISGSTVTLKWREPATGGAPAGYRIWIGTFPGASNIVRAQDVGNTFRASGHLPRGTYYARVAAYNGVGQGPAAPEVRFRIGAAYRPGRPRGFTASLQDAMAVLAWQAPAGDDADSPTGYVIEAGSAPGLTDVAQVPVGVASSFESSVPAGTYYVRVRAVNDLGQGEPSEEVTLRHVPVLGAPTALVEQGGGGMVALSWQAPTTGALPAGYVVEAGSAPGRADLAVLRVGNVVQFTTTAPPGVYYVRVRAVGADGTAGDASNEVVVRR